MPSLGKRSANSRLTGPIGSSSGNAAFNASRRTLLFQPTIEHKPCPRLPIMSTGVYLSLTSTLALIATGLQFTCLYQTTWWLPDSPHAFVVAFDEIDFYLLAHIVLMLQTPLLYHALCRATSSIVSKSIVDCSGCGSQCRGLIGLLAGSVWLSLGLQTGLSIDLIDFSWSRQLAACLTLAYMPLTYLVLHHISRIKAWFLTSASASPSMSGRRHSLTHRSTSAGSSRRSSSPSLSTLNQRKRLLTTAGGSWIGQTVKLIDDFLVTASHWPGQSPSSLLFPLRYASIPSSIEPRPHSPGGDTDDSNDDNNDQDRRQQIDNRLLVLLPNTHFSYPPVTSISTKESPNPRLLTHASCCSSSSATTTTSSKSSTTTTLPSDLRDEIDFERADFNARFTDVMLRSCWLVYYSCFVPVVFLQPNIIFKDPGWCLANALITFFIAFSINCHRCLPYDYLDTLHRSAVHLGSWSVESASQLEVSISSIPTWSSLQTYPSNEMVRHVRGLFRSIGYCNTAEPGNRLHSRFYFLFRSPLRPVLFLLSLSLGLVLVELVSLILLLVPTSSSSSPTTVSLSASLGTSNSSDWTHSLTYLGLTPFALANIYVDTVACTVLTFVYNRSDDCGGGEGEVSAASGDL